MGLKAPELSGRTVGVLGETRGGVVRMANIVAAAISSSQPSVSPHETTIHKSPMLRGANNRTLSLNVLYLILPVYWQCGFYSLRSRWSGIKLVMV